MKPSHLHSIPLYPDTFRALTRAAYRPNAGPIEEAMADRVARALALLDEHERAEEARGERYVIGPSVLAEVEQVARDMNATAEEEWFVREMAQGTVPELPAMHPPVEHKTRVPAWKGREERAEKKARGEPIPDDGAWMMRDRWWEKKAGGE